MNCSNFFLFRLFVLLFLVFQNISIFAQRDGEAVISTQGASTLRYSYGHGAAGVDTWDNNEEIVNLIVPTRIVVDGYKCEVKVIHDYAFARCEKLETAYINVYVIWYNAFSNCTSLRSIEFGPKVNSICEDAFRNCKSVISIKCHAVTPPSCEDFVFNDIPSNIPVYVPKDAIEKYMVAKAWKHFKNYKPL